MFYEPDKGHGLPHSPLKAIVAPRPIAWVSTLSEDGAANLAPFSFFNMISERPPLVMISITPNAKGGQKDTLRNILATREAVVHIVPRAMATAMNDSSAPLPYGADEFAHAGLTKAPARLVRPALIEGAPTALECRLRAEMALPGEGDVPGNHMVILQIVGVHIHDDALTENGLLDVTRYAPITRLGYDDYAAAETLFSLGRPRA